MSEDTEPDGRPVVTTVYYPPAISRREPEWLNSVTSPFWWGETRIEKLLKEIYSALHNGSLSLAAMGVRALLEHIMIEQVGDNGSIGENIKRFIAAGHIAPKSEQIFRTQLIEAGHAAMHRGYVPTKSELETLLDLTESLIASIYVHPHRATGLKEIPSRKPKAKNMDVS